MNAPPEKDAHHDMQIQDPELTLQVKEERLSYNIASAFVQRQFVFLSLCPELMSIYLFVFLLLTDLLHKVCWGLNRQ